MGALHDTGKAVHHAAYRPLLQQKSMQLLQARAAHALACVLCALLHAARRRARRGVRRALRAKRRACACASSEPLRNPTFAFDGSITTLLHRED